MDAGRILRNLHCKSWLIPVFLYFFYSALCASNRALSAFARMSGSVPEFVCERPFLPSSPQLAPLWPLPHVSMILSLYAMVRARRSKAWPGKICPLRIRMRVRGAPETPCASMPLPHASLILIRYAMVSACRGKMWLGKIHSLRNFCEACLSTPVTLLAVTANHCLHRRAS